MEKKDIILNILSKDESRISEAKQAIKDILSAKATQFRTDASKYVARKLFESSEYIINEEEKTHSEKIKACKVGDVLEINHATDPDHGRTCKIVKAGNNHHTIQFSDGKERDVRHRDLI